MYIVYFVNRQYCVHDYIIIDDCYEELLAEADSTDSSGEVLTISVDCYIGATITSIFTANFNFRFVYKH